MLSSKLSVIRSMLQRFYVTSLGCVFVASGAVLVWSHLSQANAPSDQYTITVETVTDNFTGLVWQRATPNQFFTQAQAIAFCNSLVLAGANDWRLPHVQELHSIVDRTRGTPTIDPNAFPNTPGEGFWSSTFAAGNVNNAWFVLFNSGLDGADLATNGGRVRCVR